MTTPHPRTAEVDRFFARHRASLARQGAIVATWRCSKGRRQGPYYRLDVRDEGGRKQALYLGRAEDPLVAEVRARLAQLQRPLRERRQFAQARKVFRQAQQAALSDLASELQKRGLRLQGLEVRGYARLKRVVASSANFVEAGREDRRQSEKEPLQELENQSFGDQATKPGHCSPELENQNLGDQRV